jgi:hypothetical protein
MKRVIPGTTGVLEGEADPSAGHVAVAAPVGTPAPLRTEFEFELPRGYIDNNGTLHKHGTMRLATARDELTPLYDSRVLERPAYLTVVLLEKVITRLGTLPVVDDDVIEHLFASDLAFLQDLYRRVNQEGHTRAAVACPNCDHHFSVNVAGNRPGGS